MKKLLIVDNSIVIINVLKDMFTEKNNFEIFVAKSLEEVNSLVNKHDFFLAISNMVLPDALNGELLYLLKSEKIPTIVLSSSIDDEFLEKIQDFQIINYVLKDSINGLDIVYNLAELLLFIKDIEVLIVEDSTTFAMQLKDILESLLLNVTIAKDGEEALSKLKDNDNFSMVITDLNMPNMNGFELIKQIRKNKSQTELPVIALSSDESKNFRIKLFKHGANDFLTKPILQDELKSKVIDIFFNMKQVEEIKSFNNMFDEHIISSGTNEKGIIKWASKAFCKISGYSKEELIGKDHNIVRHPDMPKMIYEDLWKTIENGDTWEGEIKNISKNGNSYWVSATIKPEFDRKGKIQGYIAIREDITDKKRIYELSITDGLTALFNRRYFNDIAKEKIDKIIANGGICSFILLDIDNFKKYNDTYGHQEGDNVLQKVSSSLKKSFMRDDDLVFRLGGEEFGILMHTRTVEDAINLTNSARVNIQDLGLEHEKNTPLCVVTASFGLVILTNDKKDYELDDIYKKADDCLYLAKNNGRNIIENIEL